MAQIFKENSNTQPNTLSVPQKPAINKVNTK